MSLETLLAQEQREDEGAWLPLPEELGGEMHITYLGNPEFTKKLQRLESAYRKKHLLKEDKDLPDGALESLTQRAMVGTVCKGIRGVRESDGGPELESTDENIHRLLDLRTVRTLVVKYARERETFRSENLEVIAGN